MNTTKSSSLLDLPLSKLRALLAEKETSATILADLIIERTNAIGDHTNCFIHFDPDLIRQQGKALDALPAEQKETLPLFGIPVSVKDMILTTDQPTTAGSKILSGFMSPYDATVVEKLRAAGALITGKTNMDEFAMGSSSETSFYGATKNPWNLEYTPGGSSGGSAASVAAGLSVVSLGTDTGGSVRQPASFCNLVGIKPTYGRVSRYGVIAYASSLDQVGAFGKSVEDTVAIYNVIAGYDPKDSTSYQSEQNSVKALSPETTKPSTFPKGLRIGLPKEYLIPGLHSDVRNAVENAVSVFEAQGAKIVEVSLPHTELSVPTYYILAPAEASSNLARYDGIKFGHRAAQFTDLLDLYCSSRTEGFGTETKRRIVIGSYVLSSGYYDAFYRKALKVRRLIRDDFRNNFANNCDVILAPVAPTPPYKLGEKTSNPLTMYLEDIFTAPVNLAGIPALALPAGVSKVTALPIGIQLIGPAWREDLLFNLGSTFQQHTTWHLKTLGA
jgi:aspartyl-tRNA(Asn)/glutamyl-tRNA(Gln) amidotransferase subunit A